MLREDITRLLGTSAFRRSIKDKFLAVAEGVTPPDLIGTTPTHEFARQAASEHLLKLAISFAASQALFANPADRHHITLTLERCLRDEGQVIAGVSILSAVSALSRASENTPITRRATPIGAPLGQKRKRTQPFGGKQPPQSTMPPITNPSLVCSNCGGKGHSSCSLPVGTSLVCTRCSGKGHVRPQCPSK